MAKDVRGGMALAFFFVSLIAAVTLLLNPRFLDPLWLGVVVFLVAPIVGGSILGWLIGPTLRKLARVGSNEDQGRAHTLLWATLGGFAAFFIPLAFLPSLISVFFTSETIRYAGALAIVGILSYTAVHVIRIATDRFRPALWPVLLALPAAAILAASTGGGERKAPGSRLLVVAVPGLSWDVADDLIERGEMPNLAALRRSGAWGELHGSGALSPAAVWTTVLSGKAPDEHGAVGFTASAHDVRSRRLWDILEERGWSIGVYGWPATWPPRPVDGFLVPCAGDGGTDAYPHELTFIRDVAMSEKVRQRRSWGTYCRFGFIGIRYGARLGTIIEAAGDLLIDPLRGRNLDAAHVFAKRKLRSKLDCDYFVELRRRTPTDFAAYYTNIVHVAQAYFWKYHEPSAFEGVSPADIARYGESVHDSYRAVDDCVGRILRDAKSDELVVILSDHGAEAITDESRRTLTLRIEAALATMRLAAVVEATNLGARAYLRPKPGFEGSQERVRRLFETARVGRTNQRAFQAWIDEWDNVVVTVNPEVGQDLSDTLLFPGGRCELASVIRSTEMQESAQINDSGALVLAGRGVAPGRIDGADLVDIMPTLLVLKELDLAADLPGDVIETALATPLLDRVPGYVATYEVESPEN